MIMGDRGRHVQQLLAYGDMAFNAFGPRNERTRASLRQAADVGAWISAQCARDALPSRTIHRRAGRPPRLAPGV